MDLKLSDFISISIISFLSKHCHICLSMYLSVCLSMYLSVCLSTLRVFHIVGQSWQLYLVVTAVVLYCFQSPLSSLGAQPGCQWFVPDRIKCLSAR